MLKVQCVCGKIITIDYAADFTVGPFLAKCIFCKNEITIDVNVNLQEKNKNKERAIEAKNKFVEEAKKYNFVYKESSMDYGGASLTRDYYALAFTHKRIKEIMLDYLLQPKEKVVISFYSSMVEEDFCHIFGVEEPTLEEAVKKFVEELDKLEKHVKKSKRVLTKP